MKIAICFFGLTRSLNRTVSSITENIIDPLKSQDHQVDVYMHTYKLEVLTNYRSGEKNCLLDTTEYKLLEPFEGFAIDDQNDIDKILDFLAYRSKGDPWRDGYNSLNNLLRQHYSLQRVTSLWVSKKHEYDAVMYCRPDVQFIARLNVDWLFNLGDRDIVVPSFLPCTGYNDRFAIGKPDTMLIYGNRRELALNYSMHHNLHAERFLKYVLDSNNLHVIQVKFPFIRVRANGSLSSVDKRYSLH